MLALEDIQTYLKAQGVYAGQIDGDFGPKSIAARTALFTRDKITSTSWSESRKMEAVSQMVLKGKGFYKGTIDGIMGPNTREAELQFYKPTSGLVIPWMVEAEKHIGLHEVMDNAELFAFLKSDGEAVGDPSKISWCGDFVSTCLNLSVPTEKQPKNPYAARNWVTYGEDAELKYGAVIVFWRGTINGWQGHVGFAVGYDANAKKVQVLGGNQSNAVTRAWLSTDRILSWRAPKGWNAKLPSVRRVSSAGTLTSTNED